MAIFLFFWFRLNEKRIHSLYVFVFHCYNNKLPETSQVIISHVWGSEARGLGCHSAPVSGCKDRASQPGSGEVCPRVTRLPENSGACPWKAQVSLHAGSSRFWDLRSSFFTFHLLLQGTPHTHTKKGVCGHWTDGRQRGRPCQRPCMLVREPLWSLGFWKEGD